MPNLWSNIKIFAAGPQTHTNHNCPPVYIYILFALLEFVRTHTATIIMSGRKLFSVGILRFVTTKCLPRIILFTPFECLGRNTKEMLLCLRATRFYASRIQLIAPVGQSSVFVPARVAIGTHQA